MGAENKHLNRKLLFRKMVFPEDRTYLFEIHRIYDQEYGLSRDAEAWLTQMEFYRANAGIYHPLILLTEQQPAGYIRAYDRISMSSSDVVMMLDLVYILPEFRGQGLGKILMQKFLEFAKASGAVRIDLLTDKDNPAALRLYESLGFQGRNRYQMISFLKANPQLVAILEKKKKISG